MRMEKIRLEIIFLKVLKAYFWLCFRWQGFHLREIFEKLFLWAFIFSKGSSGGVLNWGSFKDDRYTPKRVWTGRQCKLLERVNTLKINHEFTPFP